MPFSSLSHLECSRTGEALRRRRGAGRQQGRGAAAGALRPRAGAGDASPATRSPARPHDLWRYHEVLPVRDPAHVTTLGEGMTPLLPAADVRRGDRRTRPADEGRGPDPHRDLQGARRRGRRLPGPRARRRAVAMPTNGNAGAAWSVYAARAGMGSLIVMPVDAPEITRRECVVAGAELYLVDGLINHAGALVKAAVERAARLPGGLHAQGALPHRGQEDDGLRDRRAARLAGARRDPLPGRGRGRPDRDPQGDAGDAGARLDRRRGCRGWSPCSRPGCPPIVDAFDAGLDESTLVEGTHTLAFGINVPKALGDFLVLRGGARVRGHGDRGERRGHPRRARPHWRARRARGSARRARRAWPPRVSCARAAGSREGEQVVVLNTGTGPEVPRDGPAGAVDVPVLPAGRCRPSVLRRGNLLRRGA